VRTRRFPTEDHPAWLPLLEEHGCLTLGAMCFPEQLDGDQRAVIERHLNGCPACAQQLIGLSQTAAWVRQGQPRMAIPVDARLVARRAVAKGLLSPPNKKLASPKSSSRTAAPGRRLLVEAALWGALAMMSASLVVVLFTKLVV
jgi:anti-sigma factor RsiW